MDAADLTKDYAGVHPGKKYPKNKRVTVLGSVKKVEKDNGKFSIILNGHEDWEVACNFPTKAGEDLADKKEGDRITITGTNAGATGTRVSIANCKLVE